MVHDKAERQRMFKKLVDNKCAATQLRDDALELKEFFEECAEEDKLEDGLGKIVITTAGNGVKFSLRKGSPSKTKLKEAGVLEEIIDQCSGSYRAMEVF